MNHEVVLTIDAANPDEARLLDYERVDVCRTKQGQWVLVGYRGPLSRFLYLGDSGTFARGSGPDLFFVPSGEIRQLFQDIGDDELIEEYFSIS